MDPISKIEAEIILQNNTPMDEFLGLSPNQLHSLLFDTFGEGSPVQFREQASDETLDKIFLFRIVEDLLNITKREKRIKLTKGGALPRKVVIELYEKKFIPEEFVESGIRNLLRENDSEAIGIARKVTELAELINIESDKIVLTPEAERLMNAKDRFGIFKKFFEAFTGKFSWTEFDNFTNKPVAQIGWAFSLMMLNKFGNSEPIVFYTEKYATAFPTLLDNMPPGFFTGEMSFHLCYSHRTFCRFFGWLGFIDTDETDQKPEGDVKFHVTEVMNLFKIEDF